MWTSTVSPATARPAAAPIVHSGVPAVPGPESEQLAAALFTWRTVAAPAGIDALNSTATAAPNATTHRCAHWPDRDRERSRAIDMMILGAVEARTCSPALRIFAAAPAVPARSIARHAGWRVRHGASFSVPGTPQSAGDPRRPADPDLDARRVVDQRLAVRLRQPGCGHELVVHPDRLGPVQRPRIMRGAGVAQP